MATITTRHAVYRTLLTKVQGLVTSDVAASGVYLAAVPFFDGSEGKAPYIQIVPGAAQEQQTVSGAGGLRAEEFDVVGWVRLYRDSGHQSTDLLANATDSLLVLMAKIDGSDETPGLTNSNLADLLHGSIQWIRGATAAVDERAPGWAFVADTYRMMYEVSRERTVA